MTPPPTLADVAALRTRAARDASGTFFAEGVRFLVAAVDAGADIRATVVAPKLLRSAIGQMLARRLRARGVPMLRASPEEFAALSSVREPQGVGVVVGQRWRVLADEPAHHDALWVALSSVQSPGNLGSLLRTSDAVGATGLLALGADVDPHDPAVVRATMGAHFSRRIARASIPALLRFARRTRALVVGALPRATRDYREVAYDRPVILLLGSERKGLTAEETAACDVGVRIPMVGRTDSLNLAVAASVLLYEVYAQRHPVVRHRR